jgi:hypothetical protein
MRALLQLAERCEKAVGADRELDKAIAVALGAHTITLDSGGRGMMLFESSGGPLPLWTASLDAAMQLVPNAYYWSAGTIAQEGYEHYDDMDFGWAQVVHRERSNHIDCEAAATPALALAAAALRARAAS